jgi:hypothetical protein
MASINWRELMAWPMPMQERELIERLRAKEAAGEALTEREVQQVEAIARVARRGVHGEAGERRLRRDRDVDELFAELDKLK